MLRSRPVEREREAGEHHKVGVEGDPLKPANAERGEAVVMLEPAVLALNGLSSCVEVAEALSVSLNPGVEAGRAFDDRHDDLRPLLTLERDDGEAVALHALSVDAVGVVRIVGGDSLGPIFATSCAFRPPRPFVRRERSGVARRREASPGQCQVQFVPPAGRDGRVVIVRREHDA